MPVVLDIIFRATGEHLGDLGPLVAQLELRRIEDAIFVGRPSDVLHEAWVDAVDEAGADLFRTTAW